MAKIQGSEQYLSLTGQLNWLLKRKGLFFVVTQTDTWQINLAITCPSWKQAWLWSCLESGCRRIFEELGSQRDEYLTAWVFKTITRTVLFIWFGYCEFVRRVMEWCVYKMHHKIHCWIHLMSLYIDKIQVAFMQKKNDSYANLSYLPLPLVSEGRVMSLVYSLSFSVLGLKYQ